MSELNRPKFYQCISTSSRLNADSTFRLYNQIGDDGLPYISLLKTILPVRWHAFAKQGVHVPSFLLPLFSSCLSVLSQIKPFCHIRLYPFAITLLPSPALHCTALHCTALHCTELHDTPIAMHSFSS